MAKALALGAALCAPCAAFAPAGNLRSQAPAPQLLDSAADVQVERGVPLSSRSAGAPLSAAAGLLAAGAVGLAVVAAKASRKQQRAARAARRVAGVCEPITEKFDPLKLASTDAKMEQYTTAEIKHGRTAMIAVIGYVMPEIFRYPGCEDFKSGLGAFSSLPVEGWVQLIALISAHEVFVKPRAGGMGPWDFGLGTELLEGQTAEEVERRQTSERNNGRLAMIAIMGLMVQDAVFGMHPLQLMKTNGFWGPTVDVFIKDIPICAGGTMCATRQRSVQISRMAMRAEAKVSAACPFMPFPDALEGWVGGEKGFDPIGASDFVPVYYLRESELKHGRVCMLATVGWIVSDLGVRFPGEKFQAVTSTLEGHNKMVDAGIFGPMEATVGCFELYGLYLSIEGYQGKIKRSPGDFFLGKNFLPADPAKKAEMQLKELENGRLAMLAFGGIWSAALLTGKPWPFL